MKRGERALFQEVQMSGGRTVVQVHSVGLMVLIHDALKSAKLSRCSINSEQSICVAADSACDEARRLK